MPENIAFENAKNIANPRTPSRLIQLDILRGVAILFVLGHHSVIDFRQAGLLKVPATMWNRIGWTGVDLFFVLSGFLVGGLLFKEIGTTGRLDAGRFIIRRGFKIWPSYYLFLLAQFAWLWQYNRFTPGAALSNIVPGFFHYQNYAGPRWHTWSLAVEEHFYLLLPLLLLLLGRFRQKAMQRALPAIAVTVMFSCLIYRCAVGWKLPYDVHKVYFPTHARMDSLFCGVLIAYCYHIAPDFFAKLSARRGGLLITGVLALSPFAIFQEDEKILIWTLGYTALYLAYGAILIAFITAPVQQPRWNRLLCHPMAKWIAWVGRYSYSIYLWHYFIRLGMEDWWPHTFLRQWNPALLWLLLMSTYVAASITVGVLLGSLVEIPALKLRDRLFAARASAL